MNLLITGIVLLILISVLASIGRKFRKNDIVVDELYRRELIRRGKALIETGEISNLKDFVRGANEGRRIFLSVL